MGRFTPKQEQWFKNRNDDLRKGGPWHCMVFPSPWVVHRLDRHLFTNFIPPWLTLVIRPVDSYIHSRASGCHRQFHVLEQSRLIWLARDFTPVQPVPSPSATININVVQFKVVSPEHKKSISCTFLTALNLWLDDDLIAYSKDGNEYNLNYVIFDDRSGCLILTMEMQRGE